MNLYAFGVAAVSLIFLLISPVVYILALLAVAFLLFAGAKLEERKQKSWEEYIDSVKDDFIRGYRRPSAGPVKSPNEGRFPF